MVTPVVMPKLGFLMVEGKIVKWFKKDGERVEKGEPLFLIETEKVESEVEAPASGVLRKILAEVGSVVPISDLVAIIAEPYEELPPIEQILGKVGKPLETPPKEKMEKPLAVKGKVRISPVARKLAEDYKIDITEIEGTGPRGKIVKKDVLKVLKEAKAVAITPSATGLLRIAKVVPMTGMRETIAERLSHSYRTAVHASIATEVDMTEASKLRDKLLTEMERKWKVRLSYTDMLVKAVAEALKEYPIMNSALEEEQIKIFEDINVGVAVAVNEGLIVPVVRNADRKSLLEIALSVEEISEKARYGKLSVDEVMGGTFTISNLGMFGMDTFTPIINPPQCAILGVGRIIKKPVVVNEEIVVRRMMTLSLSFDHRIADGALAAQFLKRLKQILESPDLLV